MIADPTRPLLAWLATHDLPSRVLLLCHHAPTPGGERTWLVVRVPGCLDQVSIALPAQLLAVGVSEVVAVECSRATADVRRHVGQWAGTITSGISLLEDPAPSGRRGPEVLRLDAMPVSRRGLLGLGAAREFPFDLEADETTRTLAALEVLREQGQAVADSTGPAGEADSAPGDPSPARALQVDGCTACGVCVQACPHDALQLILDGQISTLSHRRDACRGELECARLCPVQAITDAGAATLQELWQQPRVDLITVTTTVCPRCRARHTGAAETFCPACEFRSANAFGSWLPPGAQAQLDAWRARRDAP